MMNVRNWEWKKQQINWQVSFSIESEELLIEEYVQLVGEGIVDAEYNMAELMDLAWYREIHLGLDLNEEPMKGNDVDD